MKKFKTRLFYSFLILLLLASVGGLWFYGATRPVSSPPAGGETAIFVILRGEPTDLIVNRLKQEGFIRSSLAFNLILYRQGLVGKIQAGDFRLSQAMTAWEISQALTHGTLDQWVTVIEGWRSEEIAAKLQLPANEFQPEEGYLFPDTYLIPRDASANAVIDILKSNFNNKIKPLQLDIEKSGLTLKQVIILASLLEREVKHDQDRPLVAGILIKRWRNDWPLQVDATVQYALANDLICRIEINDWSDFDWWPQVSAADRQIKSAYNTYLDRGLPPGSICNPGLASIKAVVYPEASDYWFYLSDQQGQMHYGRTLEEHNSNKKYL